MNPYCLGENQYPIVESLLSFFENFHTFAIVFAP